MSVMCVCVVCQVRACISVCDGDVDDDDERAESGGRRKDGVTGGWWATKNMNPTRRCGEISASIGSAQRVPLQSQVLGSVTLW